MKQKILIANWKSNKTLDEAIHWIERFDKKTSNNIVVVCPPFPFLIPIFDHIQKRGLNISLGIQNISPFPSGAYTGEISVRNLENLHVSYAIVGHSERRKYFHESDQEVANKVSLLLSSSITPIVCVDRKNILSQANAMSPEERKNCIVAFEPIEHIGTGEAESLTNVLEVVDAIKASFHDSTRVLYGGSVDETNALEFLKNDKIDGLLVGGKSLDHQTFSSIC